MSLLMRTLTLSWILISAPGCLEQDSSTTLSPEEYKGLGCDQDSSLCEGSEICSLVDPCGSSCEGDDLDMACAAVCIEIYACVEPLREDERCDEGGAQCAEGLSCLVDEEAGCEPSFCEDGMCTQDCLEVYTCQATPIEPCDPEGEEKTCTDGRVCGIAGFEELSCDLCDVVPEPIFGCVMPLVEGQECSQMYTGYGYDQCAEGLTCQSGPNECISCDDDGNCVATCPTPPPYCQPAPEPSDDN